MAKDKDATPEVAISKVALKIPIKASRKEVWKAIVEDMPLWWRKDFYASPRTKRFVLEPILGGKMYEDAGDGTGLTWYTVWGIEPQKYLYLVGHLTPAFGVPATSVLEITLTDDGKNTVLELSDGILGKAADPAEKEAGLRLLFEEGLKGFVEA